MPRLPPLALNSWLRYHVIRQAFAVVPPGASVLEIGAGLGAVGARLAIRYDYTGIEPDSVSADVARKRIEAAGGRFFAISAGELPLHERFDVVCAFEVLEHIEDDLAALKLWCRHILPHGWLMLSVPAFRHRFGAWDIRAGHYRRYDPDLLRQRLAAIGLTGIQLWTTGFPLGLALEQIRNLIAHLEGPKAQNEQTRTGASGRAYQPPDALGLLTKVLALPFCHLQRPFAHTRLGTGLVARGRRLVD